MPCVSLPWLATTRNRHAFWAARAPKPELRAGCDEAIGNDTMPWRRPHFVNTEARTRRPRRRMELHLPRLEKLLTGPAELLLDCLPGKSEEYE